MYVNTHSYIPHRLHGFGTPATATVACADRAIDEKTALLFSDKAPLANTSRGGCDQSAVWAFVPTPRPNTETAHVYLHGNNNFVTADATHPGGRQADWAGAKKPSVLQPGGPYASGPKYGLDVSAQASSRRPIVLVPEDARPPVSASRFWAVGAAGGFDGNPSLLGQLIDDCRRRLTALPGAAGASMLNLAASRKPLNRLFLSGHSGGGVPLSHCCLSSVALSVPTDLWLYDSTYWSRHIPRYLDFLRHWKSIGRLRNAPDSSRMVIIVGGSPATQSVAREMLNQAARTLSWTKTLLDRTGFYPRLSPGGSRQLLEIRSNADSSMISAGLERFPVVFIIARDVHDRIPLVWTPRLLATAS